MPAPLAKTIRARYKRELATEKAFCESLGITLRSFDDANPTDICFMSMTDTDLLDERQNLLEDADSWFMTQSDYDLYNESIDA